MTTLWKKCTDKISNNKLSIFTVPENLFSAPFFDFKTSNNSLWITEKNSKITP